MMGDAGCWLLLGLTLLPIAVLGKWNTGMGAVPPLGCRVRRSRAGRGAGSRLESPALSGWG